MNHSPRQWTTAAMAGIALLVGSHSTRAGESVFAWTYTTDLQPKGTWEFEQWVTPRFNKEAGSYSVFDFREEVEYGVSDNFQLSLYLNHHYVYANKDFPAEDPANPGHRLPGEYVTGGEDVHAGHNPDTPFNSYHFESVSAEAIYRIWSPYEDPLGLAVYFEPAIGDQETELEAKLLFQKNWLDDRLIWALNLNYELEFEKNDAGSFDRDGMAEWFSGLTWRFAANWFAGLEFWNHYEFADATEPEHAAFFVGPTLHYGAKRWWATVGFLRQLPIGVAISQDNQQFAYYHGYIYGDEHEEWYVRLKIGFNF